MNWEISLDPAFDPEFDALFTAVPDERLAQAKLLDASTLSCPWVNTLTGSRHANVKELRFQADNGTWRVAFAFDPQQKAILLAAGDHSGVSERRFDRRLIERADEWFDTHPDRLKDERSSR